MMGARIDRPGRRHLRLIPAGDPTPVAHLGQDGNFRKREVGPATIRDAELTKLVEQDRMLVPEASRRYARPKTRGECVNGPRPCPYVGCKHHLYLDVSASGEGLHLPFPDLEPDQLPETCALDVADQGGLTLEEVGDLLNLTRERIRQVEAKALRRLDVLDRRLGQRLRRTFE